MTDKTGEPASAVTCAHEWIITGAMGDKEKLCIRCGEWGKEMRQCPSCGGICKRSGCERANVEVKPAAGEKPVFPTIHNGSTLPGERGMTLRDWFAGIAMQGMLACGEQHDADTSSVLSEDAYKIADAMLKARTVTEG